MLLLLLPSVTFTTPPGSDGDADASGDHPPLRPPNPSCSSLLLLLRIKNENERGVHGMEDIMLVKAGGENNTFGSDWMMLRMLRMRWTMRCC